MPSCVNVFMHISCHQELSLTWRAAKSLTSVCGIWSTGTVSLSFLYMYDIIHHIVMPRAFAVVQFDQPVTNHTTCMHRILWRISYDAYYITCNIHHFSCNVHHLSCSTWYTRLSQIFTLLQVDLSRTRWKTLVGFANYYWQDWGTF